MLVENKDKISQIKDKVGVDLAQGQEIPESLEEAEIFMDANIKSASEVAAQVATNMTLKWNDFNDSTYRRCVNDIATLGMAVTKRSNDPNYGIKVDYVDPKNFVHSHTEDPNFGDSDDSSQEVSSNLAFFLGIAFLGLGCRYVHSLFLPE